MTWVIKAAEENGGRRRDKHGILSDSVGEEEQEEEEEEELLQRGALEPEGPPEQIHISSSKQTCVAQTNRCSLMELAKSAHWASPLRQATWS
ncbi:hypothetical protein JOB18_023080 [Solea senegalensis]|uniref:Uncharacterized protein n=1 Tax=Solea senegalensis TaxID=28829 RepID=A0AAV6SNX9_SOLSE|nr:hypothetical protein JOB18_023080 [Solea senegalensis]